MKQTNLQIMKWSLQTTTFTDGFRKSRQTTCDIFERTEGNDFSNRGDYKSNTELKEGLKRFTEWHNKSFIC